MTKLCCLIRKVKMTRILVVGLAVILAAAGSGRADSTTGQSGTSATSGSAGSSGGGHSSGSAHSSGSGAVQHGAQPNLPANWSVQRPLDRSELLARQSFYHRNWLNLATIQGITQSTANTGQVRRGGQVSNDTNLRMRGGRDAQNASPDRNATNGVKTTTPNTPMHSSNDAAPT